jgi:hypothetical protein
MLDHEAIKARLERGDHQAAIAAAFGCSSVWIKTIAARLGLQRRKVRVGIERDDIYPLFDQGMRDDEIAIRLNATTNSILYHKHKWRRAQRSAGIIPQDDEELPIRTESYRCNLDAALRYWAGHYGMDEKEFRRQYSREAGVFAQMLKDGVVWIPAKCEVIK